MNLYRDYLRSMIEANEDAGAISCYISTNLSELVKSCKEGRDVLDLIRRMTPDDFMGRHEEIHQLVPDFKDEDYLRGRTPGDYLEDMLEDGLEPDSVVMTWPKMWTFDQKVQRYVSPDLILETEESLDGGKVEELIEMGADPEKVDQRVHFTFEQKVKYGLSPKTTIKRAIREKPDLVRENIERLFDNGLTTEELIDAETHEGTEIQCNPYGTFGWYMKHFDLLVRHAENKQGFIEMLMEFVLEIFYESDISMSEGDDMLLEMMRKCIERKLIGVDDAVARLYGTHIESERYHESVMCSRKLIRRGLTTW